MALTVLMSSCGGSSGCNGSFDEFGNFQAGVCPSPGPGIGFKLVNIVIGAGTPVGPTPTVAATPTPPRRTTPTATPSLVPQAQSTTVVIGQQALFNADALYTKHTRVVVLNITNSSQTLWTTMDVVGINVLQPPQPPPNGGIYNALSAGCACIDASSGGISAPPVSVGVEPTPAAGCPVCPTAIPTATSTPRGHAGMEVRAAPIRSDTARVNGVLLWTFQAASPIVSQLRASSDGNLYFLTRDGNLHAVDANGRERWSRAATGQSIAVGPDGTVYALRIDGKLEAQSPIGKPLWIMNVASSAGPLAASSSAVYFQEDRLVFGASSPGVVLWRANAPDEITSAAIADDGSIIAATNGGDAIAIAPDGSHRWSFAPAAGFAGDIAIRDGVVYLGSGSGRVYAVNASSGAQEWSYNTAAPIAIGPVLNAAGPIFFGSDVIYALNSDGSLAWTKSLASPATRPLAADGEGGVLAPLDDDVSAILNSDGSVKWATKSFGAMERAVVSPSGILYVATQGTIYAVR